MNELKGAFFSLKTNKRPGYEDINLMLLRNTLEKSMNL